ncbi:MAG: hypothetical protein H8D32_01185 [Dehalococcoidia bacterium]|nr:hypothetical protein [Dehalococcoidia bacterium]
MNRQTIVLIIVGLAILFLIGALRYYIIGGISLSEASKASHELERTQSSLSDLVKKQLAEAELRPEDAPLAHRDFLDIVEKEQEYSSDFVRLAEAESQATRNLAFAAALTVAFASLVASLGVASVFYPGALEELFKKRNPKNLLKEVPCAPFSAFPTKRDWSISPGNYKT